MHGRSTRTGRLLVAVVAASVGLVAATSCRSDAPKALRAPTASAGVIADRDLPGLAESLLRHPDQHLTSAGLRLLDATVVTPHSVTGVISSLTTPFAPATGVVVDPTYGALMDPTIWRTLLREAFRDPATSATVSAAIAQWTSDAQQIADSAGTTFPTADEQDDDPRVVSVLLFGVERLQTFLRADVKRLGVNGIGPDPWPKITDQAAQLALDDAGGLRLHLVSVQPGYDPKLGRPPVPTTYWVDPRLSAPPKGNPGDFVVSAANGHLTGLLPVADLDPPQRVAYLAWLHNPAVQANLPYFNVN